MPLTVVRFDLDETVPVGNLPRITSARSIIPSGLPFVFDEAAAKPVEPILLFLVDKYAVPAGAYKHGRWTKSNSTSAAAADLLDWWANIQASQVPWDCADDGLLASWLLGMKMAPSGATGDWLDEHTVQRRLANVNAFYRWALGRGLVDRVPAPAAAKMLANQLTDPTEKWRKAQARESAQDADPHPISPEHSALIAEALGPLPSKRETRSSRTRLAYELGYEAGMRIDEILHLPLAFFLGFVFDPERPFVTTALRIERTKGLIPREVNIPAWLMHEISLYIEGERAAAVEQARRTWLKEGRTESPYLLLNHFGARHNAGKQTQAATIQAEFHKACIGLRLTRRKVIAEGTTDVEVVDVPLHTFHDTRHSHAVTLYWALESQGYPRPWLRVQKALGHAQVSTTIKIYLKVIDDLGDQARELLAQQFKQYRNDWRTGQRQV